MLPIPVFVVFVLAFFSTASRSLEFGLMIAFASALIAWACYGFRLSARDKVGVDATRGAVQGDEVAKLEPDGVFAFFVDGREVESNPFDYGRANVEWSYRSSKALFDHFAEYFSRDGREWSQGWEDRVFKNPEVLGVQLLTVCLSVYFYKSMIDILNAGGDAEKYKVGVMAGLRHGMEIREEKLVMVWRTIELFSGLLEEDLLDESSGEVGYNSVVDGFFKILESAYDVALDDALSRYYVSIHVGSMISECFEVLGGHLRARYYLKSG